MTSYPPAAGYPRRLYPGSVSWLESIIIKCLTLLRKQKDMRCEMDSSPWQYPPTAWGWAHLHVDDVVVDVVAGSGYTGVVLSRHLCHDLSHRSPTNFWNWHQRASAEPSQWPPSSGLSSPVLDLKGRLAPTNQRPERLAAARSANLSKENNGGNSLLECNDVLHLNKNRFLNSSLKSGWWDDWQNM